MGITEVIYMVILLAVGFGMGWLYAKAHTMDDYNHMYSHLTCEIISRMQQAMRSMRMDQDDIDRVIDRMGCKIMPASVPPPPSPPDVAEKYFSELRGSDDERIKKVILKALMVDEAINILVKSGIYYEDVESWLEKKNEQKPAEWSEDVQAAISLLKHIAEEQEKDYCPHNANDLRKAAQYLETCRPQNTWKPSDYELEALRLAAEKDGTCLMGLYEQLKKLKG